MNRSVQILRALYFIFSNTAILFLIVVTATHFAITGYYHLKATSQYERLSQVVKLNYSHMTPADVNDLLYATNTMGFQYAPWVGMRENPKKSRFVNVDEYGNRSNGKPRGTVSEIENAIWFFGGSTAFGYGVTDEETIPAQLEKTMKRPVANFGVGGFFSAQENLLLAQYLRFGYRPSLVIFLDGINEACEIDDYQEEMRYIFAKAQEGYGWDPLEIAKPVIYAFGRISNKVRKLAGIGVEEGTHDQLACEQYGKKQALRTVHARILAERESLCRLYAVVCRTFVQPFPGVHGRYDDVIPSDNDWKMLREKFEHLEQNWRTTGAIFVTDALDQYKHHAYIDESHYSAAASRIIARAIAVHLEDQRK